MPTVTNVAGFGAFVDVGVHQDGLVHVSQLADRFVKDPHEVVKAGDVVRVRVTEVDVPRKRIGLSMRKDGGASAGEDRTMKDTAKDTVRDTAPGKKPAKPQQRGQGRKSPDAPNADQTGALGSALLEAMKRR